MPQAPQQHDPRGAIARRRRGPKHSYDRNRGNSAARGYGHKWRVARLAFLREHPLCVDCLAEGVHTAATDVDHEIPHRGDEDLFWDEGNWRPRCHSHHSRKTARGR